MSNLEQLVNTVLRGEYRSLSVKLVFNSNTHVKTMGLSWSLELAEESEII